MTVHSCTFIYSQKICLMCKECIEIVLKLMIHNSTGVFIESSGSVLNKLHIKIPEAFQSFFMVDIDKNSRDTYIQNISLDG